MGTRGKQDRSGLVGGRHAVAMLSRELEGYARAHRGRYILFGSAARGEMRPGSDVDILVDFAPEAQGEAADFAEARARALGLSPDVLDAGFAGSALLAQAHADQVGPMAAGRRTELALTAAMSAVRHFEAALALFDEGGFDAPGAEGYRRTMAFLHAMQAGHTSLESALERLLSAEEGGSRDAGWHTALIDAAAKQAALTPEAAEAAQAARRFRHVAMHSYDFAFDPAKAAPAVEAARLLAVTFVPLIEAAASRPVGGPTSPA